MSIKTIVKENQRVCDICGTDVNVYSKCCVCGKDLCFNHTKKEMFVPTAAVCPDCFEDEKRQAIRKKYIKLHYALMREEEKEMKKVKEVKKKETKNDKKR